MPSLEDLCLRTAGERPRDGERIGGDDGGRVEFHGAHVRGTVGRVSAVHDVDDRREGRPVFLRGTERGHVEGHVEGADAEASNVALQQGADGPAQRSVLGIVPDHGELLLLLGGEARERTDAFQRNAETQRLVNVGEIPEVVGAVYPFVGRSVAAEAFDLRVVAASGRRDLRVAVDDRAAGPPQAVPHQEGVACLRVGIESLAAPLEADGDVAGDLLGREVQGVVVVEDDDAVEAVVLGDVRGRGRVLAFHAAEDVRGGALLGVAKWVPLGSRYLAVEVEADTGVERAGSAKLVEERAFEGDAVRDLYDALGSDLVNRAEGLLDPGAHGLRGVEAPRRRGDVENAVGEGAVLRGEVRDQGLEVRYLAFTVIRYTACCPADSRPA